MFVKIDYAERVGDRVEFNGQSATYECDRVFFHPVLGNPAGHPKQVVVTLESDNGHSLNLTLEKSAVDLFVMNNNGKTIDAYRWASFGAD